MMIQSMLSIFHFRILFTKNGRLKLLKKVNTCLCEKPAAITARDAMEMVQACEDHGVIFMEAFMYQFHPQHDVVREVIASGEIGDVKHMRVQLFILPWR